MPQPEGVFTYLEQYNGHEGVFIHDTTREGNTTTNVVDNLSWLTFKYSAYNTDAVYLLPHEVMK